MLETAVNPGGDCDCLSAAVDGGTTTDLHALWLRDACGCTECRRPSTNERLLDSAHLQDDLVLLSATVDGDAAAPGGSVKK